MSKPAKENYKKKTHTNALKQQNCLQNESFLLFLLRKKGKKKTTETNNSTNQMYLKSLMYKEGFVSAIVGSRMQCILLKGSQLCNFKGVYVRNAAKIKHGNIQIWDGLLCLSLMMQASETAVSQLHTHARWVSSSAVLNSWSWLSLQRGCPRQWGGGSGAKNRGCGAKKGLFTAVMAGDVGGEGWGRFGVSSTGKGNSFLLSLPSRGHCIPCHCPPSTSLPSWAFGADGQSKWWGQQLVFCQRLASPVPETSPVCYTSCLVIALWFPSLWPSGGWSSLHGLTMC